jgi:beta-lactamase superfamily II metal-dependent hydrolase
MYEIDFLPVGDGERSGDAIALRFQTPAMMRPAVVVVDGGYTDNAVALDEHIRDHYQADQIDLMVSTHPDADHINGLVALLDLMPVAELMIHQPWMHGGDMVAKTRNALEQKSRLGNDAAKFARSMSAAYDLEQKAVRLGIPITEPFAGETRFGGALTIVGPDEGFYESLLPDFRKGKLRGAGAMESALSTVAKALSGVIARVKETVHIETLTDDGTTSAENDSSVILHLSVDGKRLLLTGDAGIPALTWAADYMDARTLNTGPLSFIQIPHHGSKRNVGPSILNRLLGEPGTQNAPYSAIASASEAAPKHPARRVTNAFVRRGANVATTEGKTVLSSNTNRPGWTAIPPLPLYEDVSDDDG